MNVERRNTRKCGLTFSIYFFKRLFDYITKYINNNLLTFDCKITVH